MELSHKFSPYDPAFDPACDQLRAETALPVHTPIWYRLADLGVAMAMLLVLLPVIALLAVMIRIDSAGPAVFAQERLGRGRVPFTLLKFRTMIVDAEKDSGAVWASRNDPRITRLGRFLRRSRLDELPQLINVLRGDMSMIGPRPIRAHFANKLAAIEPRYDRRFLVRPGLTGYAQLYAPYGSNVEEQLQKIPFDQRYADEGLTFRAYCVVMVQTALRCTINPTGR